MPFVSGTFEIAGNRNHREILRVPDTFGGEKQKAPGTRRAIPGALMYKFSERLSKQALAATVSAAPTPTVTAASPATGTRGLLSRFVHGERPAAHILAVER